MKQSIDCPSIPNARELGGYTNKNGKTIKKGLLLRTGKLSKASPEDLDKLNKEFHVKKVFDFRGSDEVRRDPDLEIEGAKNYWISIVDESSQNASVRMEEMEMYDMFMYFIKSGFMSSMYVDILDSPYSQKGYHKFLKEVIDCEDGAVLWHCSAGKDRTGLAALFLLTIFDFDLDFIYEDYLLTNEYRKEATEKMIQYFKDRGCPDEYEKDVFCIEGVRLELFEKGVHLIHEKYGSVMDYIHNQLNITDEEIELLKNRYLE